MHTHLSTKHKYNSSVIVVGPAARCEKVMEKGFGRLNRGAPQEYASFVFPLGVYQRHLARLLVRRATNYKYNDLLQYTIPNAVDRMFTHTRTHAHVE